MVGLPFQYCHTSKLKLPQVYLRAAMNLEADYSDNCFGGTGVERTKYLDVQLDCHLVWDAHVKCMRTKVSRALGFLKYAKKFLPQDTLSKMYRGIVEPHFRYCCSVWGRCGKTQLDNLQKLQNRAARIVTNSSFRVSAADLIKRLGWPTISDIILCETATIMYKSMVLLLNTCPSYLYRTQLLPQ